MPHNPYIATVVIPTRNRAFETNRAVESVQAQQGAEKVQIIVIDDCSDQEIAYKSLRNSDRLIRNTENLGAPASRNIGIKAAAGELIYLLDSDDYFIERNFIDDYEKYKGTINLYYTDIINKEGKRHNYPDAIVLNDYFIPLILKNRLTKGPHLYRSIGQTSSLMFTKQNIRLFDESLPKHQDVDLAIDFLLNGNGEMLKIPGLICFDTSDKQSLSRSYHPEKSLPFIEKLGHIEGISDLEKTAFKYMWLASSPEYYSWRMWLRDSIKLMAGKKLSCIPFIKKTGKRLLRLFKRIRG